VGGKTPEHSEFLAYFVPCGIFLMFTGNDVTVEHEVHFVLLAAEL
jgi:hypothetical protein